MANPAWSYLLKFFFVPRLLVRGKNLNLFTAVGTALAFKHGACQVPQENLTIFFEGY